MILLLLVSRDTLITIKVFAELTKKHYYCLPYHFLPSHNRLCALLEDRSSLDVLALLLSSRNSVYVTCPGRWRCSFVVIACLRSCPRYQLPSYN